MLKISSCVKNFLKASLPKEQADLYTSDMEVQINAAQDGADIIQKEGPQGKRYRKYSDGQNEWGHIRIPRNAGTEPIDNDGELKWDLQQHAEGIGLTGWDWKNKISRYVAFDFDSISGHTRNTLTDAQLNDVRSQAQQIPWVTVRKSTSGKGLHLYVFLGHNKNGVWSGGVPTNNHHEHAALARSILGKMAAVAEFDFNAKVDACGGNMWVWHRKMKGTDGLRLLKKGEVLTEIPPNWRDHLIVVKGERKRTRATYIPDENKHDVFEELTGTHIRVSLNDSHKKLIKYLEDNGALCWWDADRHLLVAHTYDLKAAHQELNLKGIFDTVSTGKEKGQDQNCFCFPLNSGGWVVRRHTPGVQEHPSWDQDGKGWTRCYYNVEPDFKTAARVAQGVEDPKGGYVFESVNTAVEMLKSVGVTNINLPPAIMGRAGAKVKETKEGKLVIEIDRYPTDPNMDGWIANPKKFAKVVYPSVRLLEDNDSPALQMSDKFVRHIIDTANQDAGWAVKNSNNDWQHEPLTHVRAAMEALGLPSKDITQVIGTNILQSWKIVNKPFQPEYLGNRQWNLRAAQFRFVPNPNTDNLCFPTWQKILDHLGSNLDKSIKKHPWCIANNVNTGAEYLAYWVASMFQAPSEPLPYLFFWSKEQDTGKSSFHEALSLLMTTGYASAEVALTDPRGFNGEIASAVLCVIEEKDVAKSKEAYGRIKNWVTARMLPVHPKGGTPYLAQNCTHWVHDANSMDACPIFEGDTRITMIHVNKIDFVDMIPKNELIQKLETEAPDFLRYILDIELPKPYDRLNIPMIATDEKRNLATRNKNALDAFIDEYCHRVNGYMIKYSDFYSRFIKNNTDPSEEGQWSRKKVSKELPLDCPTGNLSKDPSHYIANICWSKDEQGNEIPRPEEKIKLILDGHKLVQLS